jgi:hypothetical protein
MGVHFYFSFIISHFLLLTFRGGLHMGTIEAQKLLDQWKLEQLTLEMGLGHTLQHLVLLHAKAHQTELRDNKMMNALAAINVTLANLRADVDALIAHTALLPSPKRRASGFSGEGGASPNI